MTEKKPSGFWETVQRSHLTRVLALYLGGSFAGLQTVDIFTDQLGLPDWVFPGSLILILLGLPIVVATALVQERATAAGASNLGAERDADAGDGAGDPGEAGDRARPLLTWRRALIGGGVVFVLWGLVVAGYMAMRHLGIGPVASLVAAGVIDERERVILSDFENHTADPLLGRAATEAFRIDLSQSTIVTVVDPTYVSQALRLMEADPETGLDARLAREVAIREGVKAVVAGEVTPVGAGFVLAARLVSAGDGSVLAAQRETASDSTEIIGAIDRLSKKLRERIGESLKAIRGNEPLEQATTRSLDALRRYSQGVRVVEWGDVERGIALLEDAVELDTAFAMAQRKLGVALMNIGQDRERAVEALTRAYENRDRLTERERYMTMGSYYSFVANQKEDAIAAYRSLLDVHPRDVWAMNNLAILYLDVRDYQRAEDLLARSIEADSAAPVNYGNIIEAQVAQGKFDAAQRSAEQFARYFPDHPSAIYSRASIATSRFEYDTAEALIQGLREKQRASDFWQMATSFMLASHDEVQGSLADAERHIRDGVARAEQQGNYARAATSLARTAFHSAILRGDAESAALKMEEVLRRFPLDSIPAIERPYTLLAIFYAYIGQPRRARSYIQAFERVVDPELVDDNMLGGLEIARGTLALAEGRYADARDSFRRADLGSCPICVLPMIGQAYDYEGETDSVVQVYERYVNTPWLDRLDSTDWWALPGILERLGALYELRGEREQAARYYQRFVELWENADPDLQPRVDGARRALERLTGEPAVSS